MQNEGVGRSTQLIFQSGLRRAGIVGDKISRRTSVAADYRILLLIGDNMRNFCAAMHTKKRCRRWSMPRERPTMIQAN